MAWDGSGNFNRIHNWQNDASASIKIKADRHDAEDNNIASGISNCIAKDGQSSPTADIGMNGKRIINIGAPVNPTDVASKAYADSLRSFNTAISLTGAVPEARIGFTQADIGFGARVAGTPAGSLNRWVWNDKPDLSGSDRMTLDETGALTAMGGTVAIGTTSAVFGTGSTGGAVRLRPNGVDSATGEMVLVSTGAVTAGGGITAVGTITAARNFSSSDGFAILGPNGAGEVDLRPNGVASSTGQLRVLANGDVTVAGDITSAGSAVMTSANAVYNTTNASNTNFPIGTVILAFGSNDLGINRTYPVVPRLDSTNTRRYTVDTTGNTALAGSWRSAGFNAAAPWLYLCTRTA